MPPRGSVLALTLLLLPWGLTVPAVAHGDEPHDDGDDGGSTPEEDGGEPAPLPASSRVFFDIGPPAPVVRGGLDADGDLVVYHEMDAEGGSDVFLFDAALGETRPLTGTPDIAEVDPAISLGRVVFRDDRRGRVSEIGLIDLASGRRTTLTSTPLAERSPDIDTDLVGWIRRNVSDEVVRDEVVLRSLALESERTVALPEGPKTVLRLSRGFAAVQMVLASVDTVVLVDLRTDEWQVVSTNGTPARNLQFLDGRAAWVEQVGGVSRPVLYDVAEGERIELEPGYTDGTQWIVPGKDRVAFFRNRGVYLGYLEQGHYIVVQEGRGLAAPLLMFDRGLVWRDRVGETEALRMLDLSEMRWHAPPQTRIMSPLGLPEVRGVITVTGYAFDLDPDDAIVQMRIRAVWQGSDYAFPWENLTLDAAGRWTWTWNTRLVPDGFLAVQAEATDGEGQSVLRGIRVLVANGVELRSAPPRIRMGPGIATEEDLARSLAQVDRQDQPPWAYLAPLLIPVALLLLALWTWRRRRRAPPVEIERVSNPPRVT